MARNDPTIYMRIPQALKDVLDAAALKNKRSLTAEVVARLEKSFDLRPDVASLHPLEALFKAYQLRQSISSLQAEITSLTTQKVSLQNILGNTKLVANLVKTDEALEKSTSEVENLETLMRSLSDDIAIKTGTLMSMESELCELEKGTPELFEKLIKKNTAR